MLYFLRYLSNYDFKESSLDLELVEIFQEKYFYQSLNEMEDFIQGQTLNTISFPASANIVYNKMLSVLILINMTCAHMFIKRRDRIAMINFKKTYELCRAFETGYILKKNYGKYEVFVAIHWYNMALLSKVLNYKSDYITYKNKCLEILDAAYPLTQLNEPKINRSIIGLMRKFCST
ncbi:unnamed protein product [Gordionus sp. m RMFG-2023]|uniref:uncharacterized protein LOC135924551 n=1 Tax=Gordionus sp. m RMFG-2023 TaxID=3053472 RepID=UPI0030E1AB21